MPIGRKKKSPNLGSQSLTAGSYRPSRCLARVVMALACKMGGRGQKLYFLREPRSASVRDRTDILQTPAWGYRGS